MFTQSVLTNAAREGARAAVVGEAAFLDRGLAAADGVPEVVMTADPPGGCMPGVDHVTVTATAPFDWLIVEPISNFFGGIAGLPDPLSSSAQMRCGG